MDVLNPNGSSNGAKAVPPGLFNVLPGADNTNSSAPFSAPQLFNPSGGQILSLGGGVGDIVYLCVCVYIYIYVSVCVCVCVTLCVCMCMRVCVHACVCQICL